MSMESQLQMEAKRMADSMMTEDHAEGIATFMEKHKPRFKGRQSPFASRMERQ